MKLGEAEQILIPAPRKSKGGPGALPLAYADYRATPASPDADQKTRAGIGAPELCRYKGAMRRTRHIAIDNRK
jgi:hypothetical protein